MLFNFFIYRDKFGELVYSVRQLYESKIIIINNSAASY